MCDSTEAIDNLYEKLGLTYCKDCRKFGSVDCYYLCESNHAPFTAEKQLELFKFLTRHEKTEIYCRHINGKYRILVCTEDCCADAMEDPFEEALASVTSDIWDLLSEEEKEEVKGILK